MSERAGHVLIADMLEAVERILVEVHLPPLRDDLLQLQAQLPPERG